MDTKAFSTRSENKQKENPRVKGMHVIGLDMGYSGPKCVHENGNFVFPNYCQKITGEIFGELGKHDYVYEDLETGDISFARREYLILIFSFTKFASCSI